MVFAIESIKIKENCFNLSKLRKLLDIINIIWTGF